MSNEEMSNIEMSNIEMNNKKIMRTMVVMAMFVIALLSCLSAKALPQDSARSYQYFYLESIRQQQQGNRSAAFDLMKYAQHLNPMAAETYFQLSQYYFDMKDNASARMCFEKAAELNPKNSTYQERLAQFYVSQQEYDKAIGTYEQLYSTHKGREDVLEILLRLYGATNNYAKMIEVLNRMEVLEGGSEQITLTKMQIYEQMDDKDKVLKELQSLVDKHPNDLNYRVMLGNWLLQNGKPRLALKEYKYVMAEEPDNEAAQISMLDYYRIEGMDAKAEELLTNLLSSPKTETSTKVSLLRRAIYENQQQGGDSIAILQLLDKTLSQPQKTSDLYMLKAAYLTLINMPKDSVNSVYEQAIKVEPDNAQARLILIQNLWPEEQYDKVIDLCRPAQQYNPDEMAFYYFQGVAYYQQGKHDEALNTFRKGVAQINSSSDPSIVSDFYAIMGDILHDKGLDTEAYAAYDSCLHWKPDNFGALNNYAYYLSIHGSDLSRAEQMSYKTIKAEPENSTFLDTFAWILFMQGRYEEAKIYIDQAVKHLQGDGGVIYEHAGDIYAMTGNTDEALQYWQKAKDDKVVSPTLDKKIKQRKYIKEPKK